MKIKNNIIHFKSYSLFFKKEQSGVKPNTVRQIVGNELKEFQVKKDSLIYISIENTITHEMFIRKLTDISVVKFHGWLSYIFSWETNDVKLLKDEIKAFKDLVDWYENGDDEYA